MGRGKIRARARDDLDQIAVVVQHAADGARSVGRNDQPRDLPVDFDDVDRVDVAAAGENFLREQKRRDAGGRIEPHQIAVAEDKIADPRRPGGGNDQVAARQSTDRVDVLAGAHRAGRHVDEHRFAEHERRGVRDRVVLDQIAVAEAEDVIAQHGASRGREDDMAVVEHVDRVDVFTHPRRIGRSQPQGVAQFAQPERAGIAQRVGAQRIVAKTDHAARAELIERKIRAAGNHGPIGNAKLAQVVARIAQIPAADVDIFVGRIE